jgi:hypothetical protein
LEVAADRWQRRRPSSTAFKEAVVEKEKVEVDQVKPLELEIEVLEERIAPSTTGYEGQPGNQSSGGNSGYEGQPGNQSNG